MRACRSIGAGGRGGCASPSSLGPLGGQEGVANAVQASRTAAGSRSSACRFLRVGGVAAAQTTPREIALKYAATTPSRSASSSTDMTNLAVTSEYRSAHNQVTHVNIGQRRNGLAGVHRPRDGQRDRDGSVVFAGGNLVRGINDPVAGAELDADAGGRGRGGRARARRAGRPEGLRAQPVARSHAVSTAGSRQEPIPAQLGYQPTDDGLRLAWQVTIDDDEDGHLWEATVDAATGDVLSKSDWTSHEKTPNPVNDGSSYRVFEFPKQDPNDGARTLVTNPADALASPFGWHDTNGAAGPGVHDHARQQRARVLRPRQRQQPPTSTARPSGGRDAAASTSPPTTSPTSRSPTRTPRSRTSSTGATWSTT